MGNNGSNESINFNYHCTKFSQQRSFFFTALSYLRDSLRYKQFFVPFTDSSSRPEEFLKILQNQQENT